MKIIHSLNKIKAEIPPDDPLAALAVNCYGYCLNTPTRKNRLHSGAEFADAIAETCGTIEPRAKLIIGYLRQLKK